MNCHYQLFLSPYLDRALAQTEQDDVRQHLEGCARCQTEVRSLLQVKEVLRRQTMPEIPTDLLAQIESQTIYRQPWWDTDAFKRRWAPAIVGVAAALSAWFLLNGVEKPRLPLERELPVAQAPALEMPPPYQRPPQGRIALHRAGPPSAAQDLQ
jgi:hypothetical protein